MTNPILTKLNLGSHERACVIDAPASFEAVLAEVPADVQVERSLVEVTGAGFALAFATTKAQVDTYAEAVGRATVGDAVVWIAYPKSTSRRYTCEFNRDTGWDTMGAAGFEPVRQVAIDEDWSALRFRRAQYIKNWTRAFAYSEEGRRRLAERGS